MCQDSDTVWDVKKRLIKGVVESAREPQMALSIPVAVNVNDDETTYM